MFDNGMELAVAALMAGFGALARILSFKSKKIPSVYNMISGCLAAMFMGIMVHFFSEFLGMASGLAVVFAGACGWAGPQAMDWISKSVFKRVGVTVEPTPIPGVSQNTKDDPEEKYCLVNEFTADEDDDTKDSAT